MIKIYLYLLPLYNQLRNALSVHFFTRNKTLQIHFVKANCDNIHILNGLS